MKPGEMYTSYNNEIEIVDFVGDEITFNKVDFLSYKLVISFNQTITLSTFNRYNYKKRNNNDFNKLCITSIFGSGKQIKVKGLE
jgi:hypothetical protein